MRRYTTLWNIYVIKLACSASCGNLAEKWTLQNPDAWQAAFWAPYDMLIVLQSTLTGNVKNIRYISILWNENDVTHFTDWGLTSLLTKVFHKVVWQHVWGEAGYCKFPGECDSERILKIGQYLTKLCVDYVGLLFLTDPVHFQKVFKN